MNLRDTFAAAVLVGMPPGETPEEHRALAVKAYAMADAMTAARGVDHGELLADVRERLHTALGNLKDVVETAQGGGPNLKKVREAHEELRGAAAALKKCMLEPDVGGGGRTSHVKSERARSREVHGRLRARAIPASTA